MGSDQRALVLADAYRKEIDQEENVWRSLPFFAATLAFQLAALFQVIDKLPDIDTPFGWMAGGLLFGAGLLTLTSLAFLARSIAPKRFEYLAREPLLLQYATDLHQHEADLAAAGGSGQFSAIDALKSELARQYAIATDHNRQINKRRERWRSTAGLAALGSVLLTVFLVATSYAHYVSTHANRRDRNDGSSPAIVQHGGGGQNPGSAIQGSQPNNAGTSANAGGHQGLVGAAGGAGERR